MAEYPVNLRNVLQGLCEGVFQMQGAIWHAALRYFWPHLCVSPYGMS